MSSPRQSNSPRPRWSSGDEAEFDTEQPPIGEWIAAIAGLVLVIGLFAFWVTQFGGNRSANAAAGEAAPSNGIAVAGTVQLADETSTTTTIATTTSAAPTTTALPPEELAELVSAQVRREQLCGSVAPPQTVQVVDLPGQVRVGVVSCEDRRSRIVEVVQADDETQLSPILVELYSRSGRVVEQAGDITGVLTLDDLGNLTVVNAFREAADCGARHETEWNGSRFELTSVNGRFDCSPEVVFAAFEWPAVFPPNDRLACVPGESTLGGGELITHRIFDVDLDGQADVLSFLQRDGATFVRADLANGASYQSGLSDAVPVADATLGLTDLDADGFNEIFVTMTTAAGDVDLVLTRTGCGWLVAGQVTQVGEQIAESNYRCLPVDGQTEIVMTASSAIQGTNPARFLHTSERFRVVNGQFELQGINRSELDTSDIELRGSPCVS